MRWVVMLLCSGWAIGCDERQVASDEAELMDAALDASLIDDGLLDMGTDASTADGATCPADEPVGRTVQIVVTNTSDSPRYVPVQGDLCAPFTLHTADGARVPVRVVNICSDSCSCVAGTSSSSVTAYQKLMPGATHTFHWEAMRTDRCEREVYCPEFEGHGRDPRFNVASPVRRNVDLGEYQVHLAYEDDLPEGCEDSADRIECYGPTGMHWFGLCEAGRMLEETFTLQAGTETVVEISLP